MSTGDCAIARPYVFAELAATGRSLGYTPMASRAAIRWFRQAARDVEEVNVNRMMENTPSRMSVGINSNDIGQMFTFFYDPKHKETLSYWDQHPLILPFSVDGKGFKGYNLHYISPHQRAKILDGLYQIAKRGGQSKVKTLPVNYYYLKSLSRFAPLQPCIKQYLWSHVRSQFMWIRPSEWDMAVMLPTARFVGGSPHKVHRDSAKRFLARM